MARLPLGLAPLLLLFLACRETSHMKTLEEYGYDPKYKQLTRSLLDREPDSTLEQAVMQHVAWVINQDYANEREIIAGLPAGIQMVYTTRWVEDEVNNGGFNQYFFNSTGELADLALAGFQLLGATKNEHLMRDALAVYEQERIRLEQARKAESKDAFADTYKDSGFESLDERFYKLGEDLQKLRIRYIREHPEHFVHP